MIQVDRNKVPAPAELSDDPKSAGTRERRKAAEFFGVAGNREKPYDKFKAYKLPAVVKALNELFSAKCAYCETDIGATQPTDVEHFRPKGGYIVRDPNNQDVFRRPGYYWLAARWENLVPSCIDCNRERTQEFTDGRFGKVGKANKFPLANEATRATKQDEEKLEEALLLDPCSDQPENHLEFTDEGVVRPAFLGNSESSRGKASIEVYGLARGGLVRRRANHAMRVLATIKHLKILEDELNKQPGNTNLELILVDEMSALKRFVHPTQEYSCMSRQLILKHYGPIPE